MSKTPIIEWALSKVRLFGHKSEITIDMEDFMDLTKKAEILRRECEQLKKTHKTVSMG